jgi:hypothetical protein
MNCKLDTFPTIYFANGADKVNFEGLGSTVAVVPAWLAIANGILKRIIFLV